MSSNSTRRKRMSYASDSERSKRLNANMIERRRMQNINSGFSSLKKLLPPSDRKQTKAAILQQASQHILRLQRAIIQFKTENDSLRSTLDMKNQALPCNKHTHRSKQHIQYSTKSTNPITPVQCDHLCDAGARNSYKCSLLPRSMHKDFGVEGGWRMFEHVKKFKPASAERSKFHDQHKVCHTHRVDTRPPTPPVSPTMEGPVLSGRGTDVITCTSTNLAPKLPYPSCEQIRPCYPPPKGIPRQDMQPPTKNIFSSTSQTNSNSKPARGEKRKSASQEGYPPTGERANKREEREGRREREGRIIATFQPHEENDREKGTQNGQGSSTGDLQCIIDAIQIIENNEYSCTGDRS